MGTVLGTILDRWFWRVVLASVLIAATAFTAVSTRYDYRHSQNLVWRVDRWTGEPQIWLGDVVGWKPMP